MFTLWYFYCSEFSHSQSQGMALCVPSMVQIGAGLRLGFLENSLTQRLMSWLEGAEPGTQEWGGKEEWDREEKRGNIEEEAPKLATTY